MYTNLQSFISKKNEVLMRISNEKFDMLCFTEIWIGENHHQSELHLPGFQAPLIDPHIRGGACVYLRDGIDYFVIDPPDKISQSVWFHIKTENNIKRLVACVYRSPNSEGVNNEKLLLNLQWAKNNFQEVVIVGDFNLPSIKWNIENAEDVYGE